MVKWHKAWVDTAGLHDRHGSSINNTQFQAKHRPIRHSGAISHNWSVLVFRNSRADRSGSFDDSLLPASFRVVGAQQHSLYEYAEASCKPGLDVKIFAGSAPSSGTIAEANAHARQRLGLAANSMDHITISPAESMRNEKEGRVAQVCLVGSMPTSMGAP